MYSQRRSGALPLVLGVAAALAACTGRIGDNGPGGGDPNNPPPGNVPEPGESALARLIGIEYRATAQAAFPDVALPDVDLPSDGDDGIFTTNSTEQLVEFAPYVTAAESYGRSIATALAGDCDWRSTTASCVDDHLAGPLAIAYRRAVTDEDKAHLVTLFTTAVTNAPELTDEEALGATLASIFLSPHFIFRPEWTGATAGGDKLKLTQAELATRLSFFLTDGPPDAALMAAVAAGELSDPDVLTEHALRLFDGAQGENVAWRFAREWMSIPLLDRRALSNGLTADLRDELLAELRRFSLGIIHDGESPFAAFFNGDYTYLDATLAQHYGVEGDFGDELERYDWGADSDRRGIITQGGLLAATAVPDSANKTLLGRGRVVFTRFFCGNLPPPNPEFLTEPVEDRLADQRCAGCHVNMDPIGIGLGQYDHLGLYNADAVVDGAINGTPDSNGAFHGARELGERLAAADSVKDCYVSLWFRYGLERKPWGEADEPTLTAMREALDAGTTRDVIRTLVTSEPFQTVNDPPPPSSNNDSCPR